MSRRGDPRRDRCLQDNLARASMVDEEKTPFEVQQEKFSDR